MNWIESETIPAACRDCTGEDCYNCDTAGERWHLSREDELKVRRKQLVRAIERLQRKIYSIDIELLPFSAKQRAALNGHIEMAYAAKRYLNKPVLAKSRIIPINITPMPCKDLALLLQHIKDTGLSVTDFISKLTR